MTGKAKSQDNQPLFDETGAELELQEPQVPAVLEPRFLANNPMISVHSTRPPITTLRLVQGSSAVGTPGTFLDPDTGESFDELALVPFKVQKNRALWQQTFSRDREAICRSSDGITAVTSYSDGTLPRYPGRECASCPHNDYPSRLPAGVEHCKPGSEVHFYDVIARNVVKIQFTPTGLRLAEGLLIDPRVFQRQVVRIIAVKETGDKGSWYKPVGTALGEITDEQRKDIVALTERFLPAAA